MAITKWIPFGQTQNGVAVQPATDTAQTQAVIITGADYKQFGLENFGNTCYANSVLQALYFCHPFRELVTHSPDKSIPPPSTNPPPTPALPPPPSTTNAIPARKKFDRKMSAPDVHFGTRPGTINGTDPSHTSLSAAHTQGSANGSNLPLHAHPIPLSSPTLFSALRSLFMHIAHNPLDKGTLSPRAFIDRLKKENELFRSSMHQDAHEFLNYLLNKIVEDLEEDAKERANNDELSISVRTLATGSSSSNSHSAGSHIPGGPTFVHRLFEGTLTSETRCLTCETVSSRDESFLDLSIDIEQNSSVTACLRQFSASEMLCQKNKFFCDSCCGLQEAEKRMKIKKLPNVLALHLKRFKYQEDVQKYIKLAYRVAFPLELRLFNTVDDADNPDRLYELFAIVVHIGNGPHHGHYVTIVKSRGSWVIFDDDSVDTIKESDIAKYFGDSGNSGAAYVLYYQAVDLDMAALGLSTPAAESSPIPEPDPLSVPTLQTLPVTPLLPPGLTPDISDATSPLSASTPQLHQPPASVVFPARIASPSVATDSVPSSPIPGNKPSGLFHTLRHSPSVPSRQRTMSSTASDPFPPPGLQKSATFSPAVSQSPTSQFPSIPKGLPNGDSSAFSDKEKEPEKRANAWFKRSKTFKPEKSRERLSMSTTMSSGSVSATASPLEPTSAASESNAGAPLPAQSPHPPPLLPKSHPILVPVAVSESRSHSQADVPRPRVLVRRESNRESNSHSTTPSQNSSHSQPDEQLASGTFIVNNLGSLGPGLAPRRSLRPAPPPPPPERSERRPPPPERRVVDPERRVVDPERRTSVPAPPTIAPSLAVVPTVVAPQPEIPTSPPSPPSPPPPPVRIVNGAPIALTISPPVSGSQTLTSSPTPSLHSSSRSSSPSKPPSPELQKDPALRKQSRPATAPQSPSFATMYPVTHMGIPMPPPPRLVTAKSRAKAQDVEDKRRPSTATDSAASSPTTSKRASRKLSLTGNMLGFGKRDKDRDKDRQKDNAPPSSFAPTGIAM